MFQGLVTNPIITLKSQIILVHVCDQIIGRNIRNYGSTFLGLPSESKNPIIAYINVPFGYLNLKRHASWNVKMLVLFLRHNYADAYMSFLLCNSHFICWGNKWIVDSIAPPPTLCCRYRALNLYF